MFNYEVTSVPCTLPSVLIVFARLVSTPSLPANTARGAFYRQLLPMRVPELSYDTRSPRFTILYQKLSVRGWEKVRAADRNFSVLL